MHQIKLVVQVSREWLSGVVLEGGDPQLTGDVLVGEESGLDVACEEVNAVDVVAGIVVGLG